MFLLVTKICWNEANDVMKTCKQNSSTLKKKKARGVDSMFLAFVEKVKPVFEEYEHSHPKITKKNNKR